MVPLSLYLFGLGCKLYLRTERGCVDVSLHVKCVPIGIHHSMTVKANSENEEPFQIYDVCFI